MWLGKNLLNTMMHTTSGNYMKYTGLKDLYYLRNPHWTETKILMFIFSDGIVPILKSNLEDRYENSLAKMREDLVGLDAIHMLDSSSFNDLDFYGKSSYFSSVRSMKIPESVVKNKKVVSTARYISILRDNPNKLKVSKELIDIHDRW